MSESHGTIEAHGTTFDAGGAKPESMVERVAQALSEKRQVRAYGRVMVMWRAPEMAVPYIENILDDARAAIAATELELAITRAIDRHYKKNPDLRVSHIRGALKKIDRMLVSMLAKAAPHKWRH